MGDLKHPAYLFAGVVDTVSEAKTSLQKQTFILREQQIKILLETFYVADATLKFTTDPDQNLVEPLGGNSEHLGQFLVGVVATVGEAEKLINQDPLVFRKRETRFAEKRHQARVLFRTPWSLLYGW